MNGIVRRVVTGQSATGRAVVSSDGEAPVVFALEGGPTLIEIWKTTSTPSPLQAGSEEPAAGALSLNPPKNGSVFRIAEIPPEDKTRNTADGRALFAQMGNAQASTSGEDAQDAMMHRTETIDYGIVLEGEITLVVDTGEVELKAGDVVVQRGANHAWSNRSDKVCRMAFVMIDALYPVT